MRKTLLVALLLAGTITGNAGAVEEDLAKFLGAPATLALDVYQHFVSPAKGSSCPMEPSDSAFARQAIRRHGLFMGALMSADRLHRCGHDVSRYPLVRTARGLKYLDPVDPAASEPAP